MEKIRVIKEMISLVTMSPQECLALVKELVAEWQLKQEDCFEQHPKRRGRKPKVSSEDEEPKESKRRGRKPKVTSEDEKPKEPKRRGRPRKVKVIEEITTISNDEELLGAAARCKDVRMLLEDDDVICVSNSKKNKTFVHYSDYPELKEQIIGPKQEFELLYKWKNNLLLSHYVLTETMPLGVYVPYKTKVFGKYIGFVIYLYDEKVIQMVNEAIEDAKTWDLIDGENWNVMDSLQLGVIKQVMEKLNRLLSKVGGDAVRGQYKTISPGSTISSGIGKIRYTLNVK